MLTKKHIEKFNNTEPIASIWNGNFKKAVIECKCNKVYASLELDSSIPELDPYVNSSARNKELSLWVGDKYCKVKSDYIPPELEPSIQALKKAVEFTEEEKQTCIANMMACIQVFKAEFYPIYQRNFEV